MQLEKSVFGLTMKSGQFAAGLIEANLCMESLSVEKTTLIAKLKSETLRLRTSREELVQRERERTRKETAAKYAVRFEKVKRHLADHEEAEMSLLTLSQITGTLECLEVLIEKGLPISQAEME